MTSYTQNPFRIKKKKTINHFSTESYRHENPSRKIIPAYNVFHQKKKQHFFPSDWNSNDSYVSSIVFGYSSRFQWTIFHSRSEIARGQKRFRDDEKFQLYDVHDNNYEAQPQLRSRINSSFIDRICLSSCRQRRLVQYASVPARITRAGKWNWLEPSLSPFSFSLILHISFILPSIASNFSVSSFLSPTYFQKSFQKLGFEKEEGFYVMQKIPLRLTFGGTIKWNLVWNNFRNFSIIDCQVLRGWILNIKDNIIVNCFENYVTHKNWHINYRFLFLLLKNNCFNFIYQRREKSLNMLKKGNRD